MTAVHDSNVAAPAAPNPAPRAHDFATLLHYPQCWDVAAYPTLESAIWEALCGSFNCSNADGAPSTEVIAAAHRTKPSEPPLIGRWHHGQGYLVSGTIRIARWDCDTNPPLAFREKMLDRICDTLNRAVDAALREAPDEFATEAPISDTACLDYLDKRGTFDFYKVLPEAAAKNGDRWRWRHEHQQGVRSSSETKPMPSLRSALHAAIRLAKGSGHQEQVQ